MAQRRKNFFNQQLQEGQPQRDPAADEEKQQTMLAAILAPRRPMVQDIAVDRLLPNPHQMRVEFDEQGIAELAAGMRSKGFFGRLPVRPDPQRRGYFQLLYGERRLRAARLAQLPSIPCEIAEFGDDDMTEMGLMENLLRKNLSPVEEGRAFQVLIFEEQRYSIRELAEKLGIDKGYIENRLAVFRAPEDVQQMLLVRPDALRAAREISKLPTAAARRALIEQVIAGQMTDRQVREQVQARRGAGAKPRPRRAPASPEAALEADMAALRQVLGRWKKGIAGMSPAELNRLSIYLSDELTADVAVLLDQLEAAALRLGAED